MLQTFLTTGVPLLAGMLLVASLARRGDTMAMVAMLFLTFVWLRVDKRFEGPHVIRFNQDHGLVLSDLVGLLILFGAAGTWWYARRRGRRSGQDVSEESVVGG